MPFFENGVGISMPDPENAFQLATCQAYRKISSESVKEMDIGWYNSSLKQLWLIELKAFHNPQNLLFQTKDLSDQNILESLLFDLVDKSIHTLCMVQTNRANTQSCMGNFTIQDDSEIFLVFLIRTMPNQEDYLQHLQDKIRTRLKPFIAIFKVKAVLVLGYDREKKRVNNDFGWKIV